MHIELNIPAIGQLEAKLMDKRNSVREFIFL